MSCVSSVTCCGAPLTVPGTAVVFGALSMAQGTLSQEDPSDDHMLPDMDHASCAFILGSLLSSCRLPNTIQILDILTEQRDSSIGDITSEAQLLHTRGAIGGLSHRPIYGGLWMILNGANLYQPIAP